jgi:hypothetical protein
VGGSCVALGIFADIHHKGVQVLMNKGIAQRAITLLITWAIGMSMAHVFASEKPLSNKKNQRPFDASAVVGEVVFTVGPAQALLAANRNDSPVPVQAVLSRGHKLKVGDQLLTGAGGHIHVRFVDGAFVAVRPESQLLIEQYSYSPEQPDRSTVKFQLMQGTARSITGRAGEAAKDRFRLNTPLAAIGVRGTDFVVLTQETESRAVVNSGAIVVAPLGQGCSADSLGPCTGLSARELTPAMGDLMARVERGKIEIITVRGLAPERSNPSGNEPRAMKEKEAPTQPNSASPSQVTPQAAPATGGGSTPPGNASSAMPIVQASANSAVAASSPPQMTPQLPVSSASPVVVSSAVSILGLDVSMPSQQKSGDALSVPKNEQSALARVQGASSAITGVSTLDKPIDPVKLSPDTKPIDSTNPATDSKPLDPSVGAPGVNQHSASADKPALDPVKPSEGATNAGSNQALVTQSVNAYVNPLASKLIPATLQWGRWASKPLPGDTSESALSLMQKGASTVISASDWSLFALSSSTQTRPREGIVDFVLRDALAYYQPVLGLPSQAEITGGSLGMDFARATFSSRLNASHQDVGQVLVMIHGTISADGQLQSAADSPSSATGVLANDAQEAAYRFSQRVTDTKGRVGSLFGLTRWGR